MGLAGASNSAVTGLQAQSTNIAITSDNIANASTIGYKAVSGAFSTLITSTGDSTSYSSGGVSIAPVTLVNQQGLIQSTGSASDLAISGAGFFAVEDSAGTLLLTRAGSFTVNNKGELTNTAGYKLLGWPLDNDGRRPGDTGNINTTAAESSDSLVVVDTDVASGSASPTTTIKVGMNLNAGQSVYQGATVALEPVSTANSTIAQGDIIVPGSGMQEGDAFTLTSNGVLNTFEYGGFAKSKDITASTIYGATTASGTFTTTGGDLTEGDKFTINTVSSGTVTFTYKQSSPDTNSGQFNNLSSLATAINTTKGLTSRVSSGVLYVSSDDANEAVTFANVSSSNMVEELGLSNVLIAETTVSGTNTSADGNPTHRFNSMLGLSIDATGASTNLGATINNASSGATIELYSSDPLQALTLTKVKTKLTVDLKSDNNGLNTATDLIAPVEVDGTSTMVPEITGGTNALAATVSVSDGTNTGTFTYGGIGASKDITASSIFGASASSTAFTAGTGGLTSGDTFTFTETNIVTGTSNTITLQYLPTPLAATDFNSLDTLATAINASANFIAKVSNNKLYIASQNNANNLVNVTGSGITGAQIVTAFGGDFTSDGGASNVANIVQPAGTGRSKDVVTATIMGAATATANFAATGSITDGSTITLQAGGANNLVLTLTVGVAGNGTSTFSTLTDLATAINASAFYNASVVGGRLYVQSATLSEAVTISAASAATAADIVAQFGGDFSGGAYPVTISSGTTHAQRFANLTQLTSLIDAVTNVTATVSSTSNAAITISADTAVQLTIGGSTNGDLLRELGITAGTVGNGFFTEMGIDDTVASTAAAAAVGTASATIPVTYDPGDTNLNMAGGKVAADFSRNIVVYDALGTGHDFRMSFLKTGSNKWAMEFYALIPSEIETSANLGDGLLSSGTINFNGDGSLALLDAALSADTEIVWTGGSAKTTFAFNLGTAGSISTDTDATVIGLTDGVRQFDSVYNVDFVEQNGVSAGQFNGITVDSEGLVFAKFSNGQVKAIYKIPVITVANPNALAQKTGNVFSVTAASGDVNLKQAGLGGSGVIVPNALEGSTSDIASELTKTIGIQANYNANATLISTVKAMEDELNRRL